MKINSVIIKAIYKICLKELFFDRESLFYNKLKNAKKELEEQYPIESLIPIESALGLIQFFYGKKDAYKIGANIGRQLKVHDLGSLGYFLLSCKHTFFVKEHLDKYQFLLSDTFNFNFNFDKELMTWNLTTPILEQATGSKTLQFLCDLEIAFRHQMINELLQKEIYPNSIRVLYISSEEHKKFLEKKYNCSIKFGANINSITYKISDINHYIPSSNYHVYHTLQPKLNELLKKWNENEGNYSLKIRRLILSNLGHHNFSFEYLATKLNMSIRNIQRQLQKEGTSYNQLLEECRKEMVIIYIKNNLKSKDIAQRLGYLETNSFARSFKKWYQMSIKEFKKTLVS